MLQAFMVVLREGIEAFLIVAITFAYLRKTNQKHLLKAVVWGIAGSAVASALLGYWLWNDQGSNQPLWEGIFATITVILVLSLVGHMWKAGPRFKQELHEGLDRATSSSAASFWGVFLFTIVMISREGMEMVLLLIQLQGSPNLITGLVLGVLAASLIAVLWQQFGYFIDMKKFFRITSVFLLLFVLQIAVQAFHEFTEAGIFPASEALHAASEPYSMEGLYGKWYANLIFAGCGLWLLASAVLDRTTKKNKYAVNKK